MVNYGYHNELDYIEKLNGKQFKNLGPFLKYAIAFIFPKINEKDKIEAWKYIFHAKPDIVIKVNGVEKYISIKSGSSKSLHCEHIETFVKFLRSLGLSEETQRTILIYQYGDGTLKGDGEKRLTHEQLMTCINDRIKAANLEMNSKSIIEAVINRCMFTGGHTETSPAEYILYGYTDYGTIVSKEEIISYAVSRKFDYIKTLHFGPLTIRPYLRDVDRKSNKPEKRHLINADWSYLLNDMEKIRNHR